MNSNRFRCSRAAGLAVCLISVGLPMAAQNHAHYSHQELRKMMREARTADQCRTLATWFREEEATFRDKAEAEVRDYEEYRSRPVPPKFPTRADMAQRLADYYSYKANQMAARATRYETELARLDPSHQPATAPASFPAP